MTLINDPARVLLCGDWHGMKASADASLRLAADRGADAIVQLGDFGVWHDTAGAWFLDEVSRGAEHVGVPVFFVDGNHENFDLLDTFPLNQDGTRTLRPMVTHLPRGFRFQWHGVRFLALGGAVSVDRRSRVAYRSWWPQESITQKEAEDAITGGPADVMLCHDCPDGVAIPGITGSDDPEAWWPAEELRRSESHRRLLAFVTREVGPTHLFHGPYHVAYQRDSGAVTGSMLRVTGLAQETRHGSHLLVELAELANEVSQLRTQS